MANAHITRHISHSPKDLMALVSDVEAYPEFINLLSALRVTKRKNITENHAQFEAEATVSYKFIRENFRSIVDVYHDENRISVTKPDRSGAVKTLENKWYFHELSDGSTLVDFKIEVRLKAYPLEILLRDKFDSAGQKIMTLFETKARQECPKVGDDNLSVPEECHRLGLTYMPQK